MKVKATKEEKREIMLRVGLGPRRQKKRFIINFWCKNEKMCMRLPIQVPSHHLGLPKL